MVGGSGRFEVERDISMCSVLVGVDLLPRYMCSHWDIQLPQLEYFEVGNERWFNPRRQECLS